MIWRHYLRRTHIRKKKQGFTLVEMAIVLVIIGLILGMVFKAKELIDSAKVKSLVAQYHKIIGAMNTFYERYGFYPGDGCTSSTANSPTQCTGTRNGLIDNSNEYEPFWNLLINTGILQVADRRSVFGQPWMIYYGASPFPPNRFRVCLDLPGTDQADVRILCAADRQIDDGRCDSGFIETGNATNCPYNENTDCWALSGQYDFCIRLLP